MTSANMARLSSSTTLRRSKYTGSYRIPFLLSSCSRPAIVSVVPLLTVMIPSCAFTRNCAFVNFTNISNAIKAIDGIKNKPEYANLRIAHGKDRCANAPRQQSGGNNSNSRRTGGGPSSPQPPLSPNDATTPNDDVVDDEAVSAPSPNTAATEAA